MAWNELTLQDTGLWGIYFVTENLMNVDDTVHFICVRLILVAPLTLQT